MDARSRAGGREVPQQRGGAANFQASQQRGAANEQQSTQKAAASEEPAQKGAQQEIVIKARCFIPEHEDAVVGICLKPNCEKKSRLVCFTCAISNHSDHAQFIVRLSDMSRSGPDNVFIRNWPTDQLANDIKAFLRVAENVSAEKYVEEIAEKYKVRYSETIDRITIKIKEDIREKLKINQNLLKDLKLKLEDTYSLESLKSMIEELNTGKQNKEQFEKEIGVWLTGKTKKVYVQELENLYWDKKKRVVKDIFKDDLLIHYLEKGIKVLEDTPRNVWPTVSVLKIDTSK